MVTQVRVPSRRIATNPVVEWRFATCAIKDNGSLSPDAQFGAMIGILKLVIPVLVPSWRFFDVIAPSPRIEFQMADGPWQPLRPKPARLSFGQQVLRLFHNPEGNQALFLTACAERLLDQPTDHSAARILAAVASDDPVDSESKDVRFRLLLVTRKSASIDGAEVVAISDPILLSDCPAI